MTKEIPLTKGYVAIVDDEDAPGVCANCGHTYQEHEGDDDPRYPREWCNGDDGKCDCVAGFVEADEILPFTAEAGHC